MEALPLKNFKWVENCEQWDAENSLQIPDNFPTGYILEVDLEYPSYLHDLHNSLPFCPQKFQKSPKEKIGIQKLILDLGPKINYVIHYRNLKQVLEHGLI